MARAEMRLKIGYELIEVDELDLEIAYRGQSRIERVSGERYKNCISLCKGISQRSTEL